MTDEPATALRDEASLAHRRGDIERAAETFRRILELHPNTPEAVDAKVYLSGLGGRRGTKRGGEPGKEAATRERPEESNAGEI